MVEKIHMSKLNMDLVGEADRNVVHAAGIWHYAARAWVFRKPDTVILQLRSHKKKNNPNKLDISVTGHINSEDDPKEGIYRELEEELFIKKEDILNDRYLGIELQAYDIEEINYINRELTFNNFIEIKKSLEELYIQESELDGMFEIKLSDMKKLFSKEIEEIELEGCLLEDRGKKIKNIFKIEDFVPRPNNYYLKIAIMGEMFLNGEKYLAV